MGDSNERVRETNGSCGIDGGEACEIETENRVIPSAVGEDIVGSSHENDDREHKHNLPVIEHPAQIFHTRILRSYKIDPSMYLPWALVTILLCSAVLYYCRVRKQQKEWRELSNIELAKIRERDSTEKELTTNDVSDNVTHSTDTSGSSTAIVPTDETSRPINPNLQSTKDDGRAHLKTACAIDNDMRSANDASRSHFETSRITSLPSPVDGDVSLAKNDDIINVDATNIQAVILSNDLSNVRARQQELHDRKIASSKQQLRQQKKVRQKQLVDSLQHDVANEAHQRRAKVISQEQETLIKPSSRNDTEHEQTLLEELREMERSNLLQQQNQEYNESLQRDQERARTRAFELNEFKMQQKAIKDAKYRLALSGVQLSGLIDCYRQELTDESGNNQNQQNVHVRLLLPSGKKFQGVFTDSHLIGLIYDFALVALDKEKVLWSIDLTENSDLVTKLEQGHDDSALRSNFDVDYVIVRSQWAELFHTFSLVSSYPRINHNDLSVTLQQSGFIESVTLLVVIESE
jgi:hypothetical protein